MLNPSGLCQCGCGRPAPIATTTSRRNGYVKGEPMRFIHGHHRRGLKHSEESRQKMAEALRRWYEANPHREQRHRGPCSEETRRKIGDANRGPRSGRWRGGRRQDAAGYIHIKVFPDDPLHVMADRNGYVREHRLVMARHLDRPLTRDEVVHHVNGVKDDNRIENLELLAPAQHARHNRHVTPDEIERIAAALAAGKTATEIVKEMTL
jgi:hypothetical protein